jgi:hypothetical protein
MKLNYFFILAALITATGCHQGNKKYDAAQCFPVDKQQIFLQAMVRYASKLPPEASHETKFENRFDWYYDKAVSESQILYCHFDGKDSVYSILVARQARSITPMQEGIAVKIKFNNGIGFKQYEEVFRTWKMPQDTLKKRGLFLFKTMINGGDLKLYSSKFQQDRFIEFPDDRFYFDKVQRKWIDTVLSLLTN